MFQKAWTGLTNIFSKLGSWFGERWNDVTSALSKVASWFGDIFGKAFDAVKNAFSSIGDFFKGVWLHKERMRDFAERHNRKRKEEINGNS